jgi:DNA polymerase-3 subunit delta
MFFIMKLAWKQIEPFLKSPDPKARAILVYGPDEGLMKERVAMLGKHVAPDLSDPFNVIVLNSDHLTEDKARLSDEANAISMMGGAKLIRVERAADKISSVFKDYLENPSEQNLVIVEAGDLSPRSSLRQLFEKSKNAAALPCYVEDERDVSNFVRKMLADEGYSISHDALTLFSSSVVGDRMRVRSEVEKLLVYMYGDKKNIDFDDVRNCSVDSGVQSMDDLVYSVASGNASEAMRVYEKLLSEGVQVVTILRTIQNHFNRLHFARVLIDNGRNLDEAVKTLQPPIFFKLEREFKGQVSKWKNDDLLKVMGRIMDLEAQSKKSGFPVETLCGQAILSISSMR